MAARKPLPTDSCRTLSVSNPVFWILLFLIVHLQLTCAVCPSGCVCDDENLHVNCVDANLDFVPITLNPLVQKLLLRNNRIRSVETGFGFYHELTFVDLSHNHLLKISPGSFASQSKLNELHLNNNKITVLSNYTFSTNYGGASGGSSGGGGTRGGLVSLIHLNLRVNLLETLEPGIFLNTKSLQELDLGQNSLRELDDNVFAGLEDLRILRLDHNELLSVPKAFGTPSDNFRGQGHDLFVEVGQSPLYHLVELFMGMNPIDTIDGASFEGLPNLQILDLKGCQLGVIHAEGFRGLGQLKKLTLTDNNLKAVPSWAFPHVKHLEVLKIGRNPISVLGGTSFRALTVLKVLDISGAPELVTVEPDTFAFNLDLEVVEISSAKLLSNLPPKLFNGISSLRSLILKENAFKSLPEDLASWQSLRNLQLQGNPFTCSCDLSWLRDLLEMSSFKNTSFLVLCDDPPEVGGRRVGSLTDKDLNCSVATPWQQTLLGITLAFVMILLVIIFVLLYRFHDKIKSSWKRNCLRRSRGSGRPNCTSSATVKAAEMDNATKTSFLSHQSAYPYSDEEFALRTSLMTTPQFQNGGQGQQSYYGHALNPTTLQRQFSNHGYPVPFHQALSPHEQYGHPNGTFCNYEAEYETPLSLGLTIFTAPNSNASTHHYAAPGLNGVANHRRDSSDQQNYGLHPSKPIPITEL